MTNTMQGVAQPHARGARARALQRAVQGELRQSAGWAEAELAAHARAHRRLVGQLRDALAADRRAAAGSGARVTVPEITPSSTIDGAARGATGQQAPGLHLSVACEQQYCAIQTGRQTSLVATRHRALSSGLQEPPDA